MKIYAVRDRMIDYYLTPFAAPDDNQVMASLSQDISRPDNANAIAQAPHHFELHLLGEMDDKGNLHPRRELVCDISTLVRARREPTKSEAEMASGSAETYRGRTNGAGNAPDANATSLPKGA